MRWLTLLLAVLTAAALLAGCRGGDEGEVLACGTGFTCADGFACVDGACVDRDAGPTDDAPAAPADALPGDGGADPAVVDDDACAASCPDAG